MSVQVNVIPSWFNSSIEESGCKTFKLLKRILSVWLIEKYLNTCLMTESLTRNPWQRILGHVAVWVVSYGISNTIVLEIP